MGARINRMAEINTEQSLTTRQAGGLLGVSVRTVQLWVEGGLLDAWKTPGGHRRIPRSSVDELLASRPRSAGASKPLERPEQANRLRVLLVEDDARLRRLYELTMKSWKLPLDLYAAENGFEALLHAGNSPPHLLITDLDLPGIDGFEMLKSLRARPIEEIGEIIVVSGLEDDEIQARGGLPDGVSRYTKPVPFEDLRRRVESLVTQFLEP